jgi:predicted dinucleotide-binding enzyme
MKDDIMTIGIIGSGALGSNVARALVRKGIAATLSTRRGPESLAPLVAELGGSIKAGTVAEAASADIVPIAVRWTDLATALRALPAWNNRIVFDATNPGRVPGPRLARRQGSEQPAGRLRNQGHRPG